MSSRRDITRRGDDGRRDELLAAASRVIARDGIAAASTRRIAEEAGVPSGLVHYWFADKDDLIESVIADTLALVETAVSEAAQSSPGAGLLPPLLAAFQVAVDDDRGRQIAMYEMTTWIMRRPELADIARAQYDSYRRVARDGITVSQAQLRAGTDAAIAAQLLAALIDGLTLAWLADPGGTDAVAVLRLASRCLEATETGS